MPARSVVVQLQPGIGQAILPDHRKMLPGIQYVIDWETFEKLSLGARQNIINVVTINSDSTTTGSFVPAQTSTGVNNQLNLQNILTQTYTSSTLPGYSIAGFAGQAFDPGGLNGVNVGVQPSLVGGASNQALTGPAGERYELVYNPSVNISGSDVLVWYDENNRFVTNQRPTYAVSVDAQGTQYVQSTNNTGTSPTTVGTSQGGFAGVAIVNIPSGNYGWVQLEGICPSVRVSGTVAAGATVSVGTLTVGKSQSRTSATVAGGVVTGSPLANNVFGTALSAGSGATSLIQAQIRSIRPKKPYNRFLNKN